MEAEITDGTYPNIHSVLIAKSGKLVYEHYWSGKDEVWGTDKGIIEHAPDSLHDIRSISKSIVSACIGIAIQQGKIKSVDQHVFDFFPEYANLDTGLIKGLTIKHLLTMTSGLKWNEDVPYDNPENSEVKMAFSKNQVEFILSQPLEVSPGKKWKYNGGTTQLLAAIIEKTTGKKIDEFANDYLFKPLGIEKYEWTKYPGTSYPAAASGLRLTSRDLMKFGLLYQQKGKWNNKQIVTAKWVEDSFKPYTDLPFEGGKYGYQFWIWPVNFNNKTVNIVTAVGNGDQRIFFNSELDAVVVITAGNYNKWNIQKNATALAKDFINPALLKK
ncbi:6-aminohexanoate-dimer hydrolase [compost metagenome]